MKVDVLSIEFDKVYLVRKKRISLGWTSQELSFLLGHNRSYVRDIENPIKSPRYNSTTTNYLRRIFFNCKLSEIMSPKIASRYYKLEIFSKEAEPAPDDVEAKKDAREESKKFSFKIYMLNKDSEPTHFCSFTQDKDDFETDFSEFVNAQLIIVHVEKLFNGNFFNSERTALEIFESCVKKHGRKVRPCDVENAIKVYTGKKKAPRLMKSEKTNEMHRFTYKKEI